MWWKCSRIIFYIWAQFSTGNKLYFCFLTQILNMAISDYYDYGVAWGGGAREGWKLAAANCNGKSMLRLLRVLKFLSILF